MAVKKSDIKSGQAQGFLSKQLLIAALIALAAILLSANTFTHGYVLDDVSAITENWVVQQGTEGIKTIWETDYRHGYWSEEGNLYRPLTLTLFAWEWQHWPNNPSPAHIINVLLYAGCCVLLFFLLNAWFGIDKWFISMSATAIFLVHPIHTEVVANIKSADELLAVLFALSALIAIWKNGSKTFSLWIPVTAISFFLALCSKEGVVTLIPIVPLAFYFFSNVPLKKSLISTSWFLLPLLGYFILRSVALGNLAGSDTLAMIDNILVHLKGADRLATTLMLGGLYVWKLFIPHPLSHDYSFNQIEIVGFGNPLVWISIAVLGLSFWLVIRGWKSKSILSFGILFFLITFSIYSNLVLTIGTHFGERLLFLPSIGFSVALAWLFWKWATLKSDRFEWKKAMVPTSVLSCLLIIFAIKTEARNAEWATEFDLYTADVKSSPNSSRAHYRLGMAYMKERALKSSDEKVKNEWLRKAVGELKQSVKIYPRYADAQSELGLAFQRLGQKELAVERYKLTLKIDPNHRTTLNNLGTVLFEQAKFEAAIKSFNRAIEVSPRYKDAMGNLASCYGTIGQYDDAIKWFKRALLFDPNNASYYYFIGITYQRMNNKVDSDIWLEKAYRLDPKLRPAG